MIFPLDLCSRLGVPAEHWFPCDLFYHVSTAGGWGTVVCVGGYLRAQHRHYWCSLLRHRFSCQLWQWRPSTSEMARTHTYTHVHAHIHAHTHTQSYDSSRFVEKVLVLFAFDWITGIFNSIPTSWYQFLLYTNSSLFPLCFVPPQHPLCVLIISAGMSVVGVVWKQ